MIIVISSVLGFKRLLSTEIALYIKKRHEKELLKRLKYLVSKYNKEYNNLHLDKALREKLKFKSLAYNFISF